MKKDKNHTIFKIWVGGVILGLIILSHGWAGVSLASEKPQYGGILTLGLAYDPPTYDAHRESTIGTVQPALPHYSLLVKVDPDNYPKIIGDLAETWTLSGDHKTYTFKIHKGVKFHDGSLLTAKDVKASYDKIIFPLRGSLVLARPSTRL
jgi:peptide/nickel transport system substrate-binding protein